MADWQQLVQERGELLHENDVLLKRHCEAHGVDPDEIVGEPRAGAVLQDPLLNEVYDLKEFNLLLRALLEADDELPEEVGDEPPTVLEGQGDVTQEAEPRGGETGTVLVEDLDGVTPELAANLRQAGFGTIRSIAEAEPADLVAAKGVGKVTARRIHEAAVDAVTAPDTEEDDDGGEPQEDRAEEGQQDQGVEEADQERAE